MAETRQYDSYTNFEIVYQLQNQVRIKAPCLFQDPQRAYILETLLRNREAIEVAQAVPEIASVAILFDPVKLPPENLLILLDAILTNIGSKTSEKNQQMNSCPVGESIPEAILNFAVKGLSCASCALYLEMVLKHHACVSQASVDFASATARVQGHLAQNEIKAVVENLGFDLVLIDEATQHKLIKENSRDSELAQKEPVLSIWL